jgi:hypothetical protein
LFFLAGTTCLLLAHAFQNLGDSASAMTQVRAALTCAEQADHNGLHAWTHGTAALIAEWTHQHRRAIEFAQRGQPFAPTADSRVRLAPLEARAAAALATNTWPWTPSTGRPGPVTVPLRRTSSTSSAAC